MDQGSFRDIEIDGAYRKLFDEFVSYKRGLGYQFSQASQIIMRSLSRFLAAQPLVKEVLSREHVEGFCARKDGERTATQLSRTSHTRQFCLFLANKGYDCYVPPKKRAKATHDFVPHVITEDVMASIIAAADAREPIPWPPNCRVVMSMLLRLLWCCGLRLSEALHLELGDVDMEAKVLTIRKAKDNKTRMVPMSGSCNDFAKTYWEKMGFSHGRGNQCDPFFPSPHGGRYHRVPISVQIKGIMREAGITIDGINTYRTHDIRHGYALRALEKMEDEGIDPYCGLPLLSAFMGHCDIQSTEYYLRLTGHGHKKIAETMERSYDGVFPEVCDE